jgi:hypothetical protein
VGKKRKLDHERYHRRRVQELIAHQGAGLGHHRCLPHHHGAGLRGKVAAAAMSGLNRAKRLVKHNPALFEMAQRLRSALR